MSQGLDFNDRQIIRKTPLDKIAQTTFWKSKVSPDVREFIEVNTSDAPEHKAMRKEKLLPEDVKSLLLNPALYFSRPHRVPVQQRKQVYLCVSVSQTAAAVS